MNINACENLVAAGEMKQNKKLDGTLVFLNNLKCLVNMKDMMLIPLLNYYSIISINYRGIRL